MAEHNFYSDRVNGPQAAIHDVLPTATSRGLLGLLDAKIKANWLARGFPERCPDGQGICDTDLGVLSANLQALVPGAPWPLLHPDVSATDEVVFDLVEYAAVRVAEPVDRQYHSFFRHFELGFNEDEGRQAFRTEVNAILRRGQTMYELRDNGEIHRRGTPEVQTVIVGLNPASGDDRLDELIVEARSLYTSHRPSERAVALERLWDAFERLKTIDLPGGDKRQSVQALLSNLDVGWRDTVEAEMKLLTDIGNQYSIRHHETRTTPVPEDGGADYLFARMGALITLLLRASHRIRSVEATFPWSE
ncbi:hypothetical protein B8281_03080 [Cellulosimicrobium sp. TH-20]|uniref:hypothetical protein n=1 Tax=Cellulosimicrobium sp. TH-20 TaxID=1980001 RepID=UPI000A17BC98|nr:hypothetical protein [Cellulosimicrobium sp. TH-20]ARK03866.1 hypothetical protein B8281_03080 [Cellulosimicrobium sp. TH-20]